MVGSVLGSCQFGFRLGSGFGWVRDKMSTI